MNIEEDNIEDALEEDKRMAELLNGYRKADVVDEYTGLEYLDIEDIPGALE